MPVFLVGIYDCVYTLLQIGSKLIPHIFCTGGSKVRLFEFRVDSPRGRIIR